MTSPTVHDPALLLRAMFDAAIAAAQPMHCIAAHLPAPDEVTGRLLVIGAGKASAEMARAVEQHWRGPKERLSGLVVTRYGYAAPCERTRCPTPPALPPRSGCSRGYRACARTTSCCA
jgi:glycerate 2-kinase